MIADSPRADGLQLELALLSRQGGRDYNEDACGHWHGDAQLCCVVADGAGGMGGGDVASKLVVRHGNQRSRRVDLGMRPDGRRWSSTPAHVRCRSVG